MAGIKELAVARSDVFLVELGGVAVRPGWNCRDTTTEAYAASVEQLADQIIAAKGIKQPLTGSMIDGVLVVTDGHRRLDAMRLLEGRLCGESTALPDCIDWRIPIRMEPPKATEADRIITQIVRNSGVPFTPLEQASVVARLLKEGLSVQEIAEKIGYTDTRVRQLADMNELPEEVKDHVRAGDLSPTMAHSVVRKAASKEDAVAALNEAVKVAKSSGKAKASPKHLKGKAAPKKSKAEVKAAAKAIADALASNPDSKASSFTREQRDAAFAAIREIFTPSVHLSITDNADESVTLEETTTHEKIAAIRSYFDIPEGPSNVEEFV